MEDLLSVFKHLQPIDILYSFNNLNALFKHLQPIDILYSFNNLNARVQQLITPYSYDVDLTNVSKGLFNRFCSEVLPLHLNNIRSITFRNIEQFEDIKYSLDPSDYSDKNRTDIAHSNLYTIYLADITVNIHCKNMLRDCRQILSHWDLIEHKTEYQFQR
ncbi:unnamed protein product [Didymodactylos carnosus]|uniref:Uncharacterized protein n=1 Tax=Didymodactylos carnosus TaxID=1234261 RepID=A0A8S2JCM2_9BILA|nr:unnamed protein product [Didymodactylos carnosus]